MLISIRYISVILLIFLVFNCSSYDQNIVESEPIDVENIDIEKRLKEIDGSAYAGTWLSIEGADTLVVILEAGSFYHKPFKTFVPQLYGTYDYSKGSSSKLEKVTVGEREYTLRGGFINDHEPRHYVSLIYSDMETYKSGRLRLYLDEKNKNKLHWVLLKNQGSRGMVDGFSVPDSLTLVRVGWN